jgi:cystathionine beta-lyase family protein involved in aluminum resistance
MARISLAGGEHALSCALFACLRPGMTLLVASGHVAQPAAQLLGPSAGSLQDWCISTEIRPLLMDGSLDIKGILQDVCTHRPEAVLIQRAPRRFAPKKQQRAFRSGGSVACESWEDSSCEEQGFGGGRGLPRRLVGLAEVAALAGMLKREAPSCRVIVDNAGAELLEGGEPGGLEGVHLVTGSLFGGLGGSVATEGGYVAGMADLVECACARLSAPGLSLDAGSVPGDTQRLLFQGMPHLPASARSRLLLFVSRPPRTGPWANRAFGHGLHDCLCLLQEATQPVPGIDSRWAPCRALHGACYRFRGAQGR